MDGEEGNADDGEGEGFCQTAIGDEGAVDALITDGGVANDGGCVNHVLGYLEEDDEADDVERA
eukprot:CAMPEP_0174705286 /NCGR_PEP_ID=MMETSP1094-20130205/8570_1 /TAXON_ID=156173 /ORGANISM="Chrysochromulina brevifilum, Strain UTEX LB 985" /LENGTH=62 /DNA_ID=CAMNT_0015903437 /DNA_START=491 /DNA_END=679 /DNA_ORIENTATION=+